MELLLKKITGTGKYKTQLKRICPYTIGFLLVMVFILISLPVSTAKAASGLKIYDYSTNKTTNYTGKQIKVLYNGRKISIDQTPGILVNGIALVPYEDIFTDSAIGVDYTYNKDKGTLTISKGNTKITMTLNSKNAVLNGKSVTLPVAPVKIKYVAANVTKILVPSRFISENMGLGYTWYNDTSTVEIVKDSLSLSYNGGLKFEYTGTKGNVIINGTKLDLGAMPSVILNNTALLRAKKVFADSKIDADYSYNKDTKTVTLSKNGNVLVMTIGNRTAYLNGKPITLSQGPVIVENYETGTSYVMVPGSVTATSLGYDYTWNKSSSTSLITLKNENNGAGGTGGQAPELGGDDTVPTGTVLYQWKADESLIGKNSGVHELNSGLQTGSTAGDIYSVTRDYTRIKTNTETFAITGTAPFGNVTSNMADNVILIQASNMETVYQSFQMYGVCSNFLNNITTSYNPDSQTSTITLQLMSGDITYDISMSADGLTLYVTLYMNSLTSAVIGTNASGDYLTLTGADADKMNISVQTGFLYLDLPNTINGIGDINTQTAGTKLMSQFFAVSSAGHTQLIMKLADGYEYYISKAEGKASISLVKTGNSTLPDTPPDIDTSKYEIIIPKPDGVTADMITHEDYYFDHQFAIKISGNYTAFYNSHPVIENSKVITDVSVSLNNSGQTEILFTTSKLQGYKFETDDKYIYVHIGDPRDIYKNIVVLDPGHGGPANGAVYFGTNEKDNNLKILYEIGKKYFDSDPWSLKVYYTRTTDVDMSLSDRAGFASKVGADLFVSLHMNASTASSAHGTEVYYASSNEAKLSGMTSKTLATMLVNNLTDTLGTVNRGAMAERYTVVYKNTVPAVLIELGFLSNQNDHALITSASFQDKAVKEIYETLLEVFDKYPTGR